MLSYDGIVDAERRGAMASELMRRHDIPATPQNYAVWYGYVSRTNPALVRTIDILIDNGQGFDQKRCADLFERFVADGIAAGRLAGPAGEVEAAANRIAALLAELEAGTGRYGATLSSATASLDVQGRTAIEVGALVAELLSETRTMQARNEELRGRLDDYSREMGQLRERLEQTQREATTDALTELANRKAFDAGLADAAGEAMERGSPLTLLMLDIDRFKLFNDTYGHQLGDQVIRLVARTISEAVRDTDLPARYGGEEFAVILRETDLGAAVEVAERIRRGLGMKHVVRRSSGEDLGTVSLSIGVAVWRFGESLPILVERADAALYLAKQTGRDRVKTEVDLDAAGPFADQPARSAKARSAVP